MRTATSEERNASLRVIPVCGTRRKSWQVVNAHGALVRFFDGSVKQARAEAARIGAEVVLK